MTGTGVEVQLLILSLPLSTGYPWRLYGIWYGTRPSAPFLPSNFLFIVRKRASSSRERLFFRSGALCMHGGAGRLLRTEKRALGGRFRLVVAMIVLRVLGLLATQGKLKVPCGSYSFLYNLPWYYRKLEKILKMLGLGPGSGCTGNTSLPG